MSRIIASNLKHISVYKLKEWGCFEKPTGILQSSGISWGSNESQATIGYEISFDNDTPLRIELSDMTVSVGDDCNPLINIKSTRCNFGNKRYWFECPKCSRRSAKLYLYELLPYCRKCLNLTYESNNRSANYRQVDLISGVLKAESYRYKLETTNRYYYAGKPTKTFKSFLKHRKTTKDLELFKKYLNSSL